MSERDTLRELDQADALKWTEPSMTGGSFGMDAPGRGPKYADSLPPGAYNFGVSMAGPYANPVAIKDDDLILFEDPLIDGLMAEITSFWGARDHYLKLGCHYKRGIVLYGPPGTGKSGILRILAHKLIEQGGLVAICDGEVCSWQNCLPYVTKVESPDRKIMVIIEDFESAVGRDEHEMLQLLDGIGDGRDGVLYIGTTNMIRDIPARIMRPSRFDTLIEVNELSAGIRLQYIQHMANKSDLLTDELAATMVEASAGLTMAQIKELVIACLLYEQTPDQVRERFELLKNLCREQDN